MTDTHKQPDDSSSYEVRSNVEKLAEAILVVMDVARSNGVKGWLIHGPLLGMVRENRLLPWNNDAELACWHGVGIEKKFKDIADILNKKGYLAFYCSSVGCLNVLGGEGVVVNLNAFWREDSDAVRPHEIMSKSELGSFFSKFFYKIAQFMATYTTPWVGTFGRPWTIRAKVKKLSVGVLRLIPLRIRSGLIPLCYETSRKCGGTFQKAGIPAKYFESCSFIDFYGGKVLVPDSPDELLVFIYGREWRIPKDQWIWHSKQNEVETSMKVIDEIWDYGQMEII